MKRAAAILATVLAAGILYEQIGERRDRNRYARIGRAVDIGGRTLNLFCSGEGSPTVIFEGAGHTAGYAWAGPQSEAAKFTHACWYDRAGYGWSDSGPSPRTFKAIAQDLHALLSAAGVPGPYVLVGATAAASHVRVYNALYPTEVAGAVLIHAIDPDIFAHEPVYMKGAMADLPAFVQRFNCEVMRPVTLRLGLLRLMGNPGAGRPFGLASLPPQQQKEVLFLSNYPATVRTEGEGCALEESMAQVRAAGNFGNRPLIVLTSSKPFSPPEPRYEEATAILNDFWFHELQPRLAALSERGRLVLAEHAEEPAAIVDAVRSVVREVRSSAH